MGRLLKLMIGLLLLPLCVGTASAVWRILEAFGGQDTVWMPLAIGAASWAGIYMLFPRPMWLYVTGHELTHALWTWGFGGRVHKLKVTAQGGHAEVSKNNFLIALAPYFFPFYAVTVVLLFVAGRLVLPWDRLELWFLLLLGAAYAFHVTLTAHILKTRQSDITQHGYVFSTAVIFIGNALVLVLGIPLLSSNPKLSTAFLWCWQDTVHLIHAFHGWLV